jgi:hypothetical protein
VALVMATDMAIGMGAVMAWRGHGRRDITEMTAAMYLPFAIFFPATLAGAMARGCRAATRPFGIKAFDQPERTRGVCCKSAR